MQVFVLATINRIVLALLLGISASGVSADKAFFAGGCFWCMEDAFEHLPGVSNVVSGFTGGTLSNPTYSGNHSGHYEAVAISFDPTIISYQQLLDVFWRNIDPFDPTGQFCDKGSSYLSAIFVSNDKQRRLAEASARQVAEKFPAKTVVTPVLASGQFWPVEEKHQNYANKNPLRYKYYRYGCGRDKRLKQIWGK